MNLPYLTGRCSLQPGPLIALTAISVGLCVLGKAQWRAPAHLHPLLLPETEKLTITQFCVPPAIC